MISENNLDSAADRFIALDRMKSLVFTGLLEAGRIDSSGVVRRQMLTRRQYDPTKWTAGPRLNPILADGPLVPATDEPTISTDETGLQIEHYAPVGISTGLYRRFTGNILISMSEETCLELDTTNQRFHKTLQDSADYDGAILKHQRYGAYHIDQSHPQTQDIAETRIYVAGSIKAVGILQKVIDAGAEFSYAKAWVPALQPGGQQFRTDTPIFQVVTKQQLHSTLRALGEVTKAASDVSDTFTPSLVGVSIPSKPDMYVGQVRQSASFNGTMANLFAEPIKIACQTSDLNSGDTMIESELERIATDARAIAIHSAKHYGIHNTNHALLYNQPVSEILDIIESY